MAKNIRTTEIGMGGYWDEWKKFSEDTGMSGDHPSSEVISEEAKRTGETIEVVNARKWEEYQLFREMFAEHWAKIRAPFEQNLLIRNNLLDSFCSVYQRADRILTNLSVEVFLNELPLEQSPAWNDGKNVTFNASKIADLSDDTVTSLHGLNYHELAHLLYTPRIGTALGKWITERKTITHTNSYEYDSRTYTTSYDEVQVVEPKRAIAFNILEDCRAEYFMTLKYPSTRPFFVALLGEYIAKNSEQLSDNFILLAGRRYFSLSARQYSAMAFAKEHGQDKAQQVYSICSEYRTLVYPRDYTRGQELIEAIMPFIPDSLETPNGCANRPIMRNGKPATQGEQETLVNGDPDKDSNDLEWNGGYSKTGEDSDGEVTDEQAQFNTKTDSEVMEAIEQAVRRAKSDPSLVKKVSDTTKAINKDSSTKSILGKTNGKPYEPTQAEVVASRLFGQELERIRIDSDPAWELERPTGKLNVRRAMNSDVNEVNKLFDRWTMGNDEYDIEACILLDKSGSMYSEIGSASRSAWIIKRAIEKINGKVTVMTFNHESRILYSRDQRASATSVAVVDSSGGTEPRYGIMESQRIFEQSQAKTKLLFLLTDGVFDNDSDSVIEAMNRNGVFTSIVFLSSGSGIDDIMKDPKQREEMSHRAKNFRAIASPNDLVKVAKDVVKYTIKTGK